MAANWKFIFSRRGIKLVDFLEDCDTVEEAVTKFEKAGIEPPAQDEILEVIGSRMKQSKPPVKKIQPPPVKKKVSPKKAPPKPKPKKADDRLVESPRKVDDLVVL